MSDFPDNELCIIIAGSQGQEGSSLVRAVYGEHREVSIGPSDKVIFSADAIPGNEIPYYQSIDQLFKNGVEVVYPEIEPGIHQSGHASAPEQLQLLKLLQHKYAMPIGGADRHRVLYERRVAAQANLDRQHTILPESGQIVEVGEGRVSFGQTVELHPQTVDGLGIGDVGKLVLSDRKALSQSGMIVVVIPRQGKQLRLDNIQVISRGFVYLKESQDLLKNTRFMIKKTIEEGVYAIEPFSTNGLGRVKDGKPSGIYRLERDGHVRDDFSREVLAFIYENYKTLPFCSRWIYKKFGSRGLLALKRIEDVGILHNYPRLMEAGNGKVAQAEETTLLAKDKKIITTL